RTASGTAKTASPLTTTTGTVHSTSTFTPWPALVTTTSFSPSGTPAALAALITLLFSSREGTVSTPSADTISSTALLTAIHDHAPEDQLHERRPSEWLTFTPSPSAGTPRSWPRPAGRA